ncbi:hypothetical protein BH23CYA1_BH23CYA1_14110 [soil metagenome]
MSQDRKKFTKKELLDALEALEKNPNDKLRIMGQIGITGLGAVAAGGAVAAIGVSSSIPLVTALTGYVLISATPVGWVAGAAMGGAAVAYGFSKLIQSGAEVEGKKKELLSKIKEDLKDVERKEKASQVSADDKSDFYILLKLPLEMDWISPEDAQALISSVENGQISLSRAYKLVTEIVQSEGKQDNH